jgi:hypothetical protein
VCGTKNATEYATEIGQKPSRYRDGKESHRVEISRGQVDWEEPSDRVHRAVNVGKQPYEQVTVFLLDRPDAVAQPTEEQVSSLNNPRGAI